MDTMWLSGNVKRKGFKLTEMEDRRMTCNEHLRNEIRERLNSDTSPIKCPLCGHDFVHVSTQGLDSAETGTRQGGCAVLMEGECGHTWGTVYAEHKGQVVSVPVIFEALPLPFTKW